MIITDEKMMVRIVEQDCVEPRSEFRGMREGGLLPVSGAKIQGVFCHDPTGEILLRVKHNGVSYLISTGVYD